MMIFPPTLHPVLHRNALALLLGLMFPLCKKKKKSNKGSMVSCSRNSTVLVEGSVANFTTAKSPVDTPLPHSPIKAPEVVYTAAKHVVC